MTVWTWNEGWNKAQTRRCGQSRTNPSRDSERWTLFVLKCNQNSVEQSDPFLHILSQTRSNIMLDMWEGGDFRMKSPWTVDWSCFQQGQRQPGEGPHFDVTQTSLSHVVLNNVTLDLWLCLIGTHWLIDRITSSLQSTDIKITEYASCYCQWFFLLSLCSRNAKTSPSKSLWSLIFWQAFSLISDSHSGSASKKGVNGWTDEQMNGWTDEQLNGWTDEWMTG